MNAGSRLGVFGVGLVALFGVGLAGGRIFVPDDVVESWQHRADERADERAAEHDGRHEMNTEQP